MSSCPRSKPKGYQTCYPSRRLVDAVFRYQNQYGSRSDVLDSRPILIKCLASNIIIVTTIEALTYLRAKNQNDENGFPFFASGCSDSPAGHLQIFSVSSLSFPAILIISRETILNLISGSCSNRKPKAAANHHAQRSRTRSRVSLLEITNSITYL
uniref:Uncharacterized protein n=1 Tax=Nelumbo nucifera TaxID=4432 RepID=A0A822XZD3_NELNU|nr:TPA_asm: hypothetical protein HUJ06_028462 [Nelumbo nucifera]